MNVDEKQTRERERERKQNFFRTGNGSFQWKKNQNGMTSFKRRKKNFNWKRKKFFEWLKKLIWFFINFGIINFIRIKV
jgi:hypothetical protein